jgi:hypothetical protein
MDLNGFSGACELGACPGLVLNILKYIYLQIVNTMDRTLDNFHSHVSAAVDSIRKAKSPL